MKPKGCCKQFVSVTMLNWNKTECFGGGGVGVDGVGFTDIEYKEGRGNICYTVKFIQI